MKSSPNAAGTGAVKKKKKTTPLGKFIFTVVKMVVIFLIAIGFATVGIVGGAIVGYISTATPINPDQIKLVSSNKTTFIYDMKGNVIQKLTGKDNKDSEPINYQDAPQFLKDAIISIEDERFESHHGVDIQGIINAGLGFVEGIFKNQVSKGRGGSTITQQVVKNITQNTQRSLQRKVQEWYQAVQLEKHLSKWQILELYMNTSYWGHGCSGVQSASKKYFGTDVKNLDLAQCALLAGITNSPGTYDPFTEKGRIRAKNRQEIILKKMLELGKIDLKQYDQAVSENIVYASPDQSAKLTSVQSYFVDQVISDVKQTLMKQYNYSSVMASNMIYNDGLEIYTTMDPDIQSAMDSVYTDDTYFPTGLKINKTAANLQEHPQSAMVILDAQNGQVRALYGGYGKKEASNTLNRASSPLMQRQPGSSFKPIAVYAPAIDLHKITPATVIDDKPVYMDPKNPEKPYPKNVESNGYDGLTSIRNAIKNSVNVVAATVWRDYLGADNSINYLSKVGIDRPDEKWVSLALGGLQKGVNPLQMAAAYVPFDHDGMYFEPTTFTQVKDSNGKVLINKKAKYNVAYSEQTAFLMRDMMQEVTSGQDSTYPHGGTAAGSVTPKTIGMPVAGKTGTSSDYIDKWFVGYTPYYVAATWYGYDNNNGVKINLQKPEYNQALKIWAAVMQKASRNQKPEDFPPPPSGIVQKNICIYSGKVATSLCEQDPRTTPTLKATKLEYFIKGTEPKDDDTCTLHVQASVDKTTTYNLFGNKVNLLAGPYCPPQDVITKVFIQRIPPYVPVMPGEAPPKDVAYELPAGEYCNIHGPTTVTAPANSSGTTGTGTNTGTP